jgi:hypothetical protein
VINSPNPNPNPNTNPNITLCIKGEDTNIPGIKYITLHFHGIFIVMMMIRFYHITFLLHFLFFKHMGVRDIFSNNYYFIKNKVFNFLFYLEFLI